MDPLKNQEFQSLKIDNLNPNNKFLQPSSVIGDIISPISDIPENSLGAIFRENSVVPSDQMICNCGKVYSKKNKFSIYDKDFCSMHCLRIYKSLEDAKKITQRDQGQIPIVSYGGGPSCF